MRRVGLSALALALLVAGCSGSQFLPLGEPDEEDTAGDAGDVAELEAADDRGTQPEPELETSADAGDDLAPLEVSADSRPETSTKPDTGTAEIATDTKPSPDTSPTLDTAPADVGDTAPAPDVGSEDGPTCRAISEVCDIVNKCCAGSHCPCDGCYCKAGS